MDIQKNTYRQMEINGSKLRASLIYYINNGSNGNTVLDVIHIDQPREMVNVI